MNKNFISGKEVFADLISKYALTREQFDAWKKEYAPPATKEKYAEQRNMMMKWLRIMTEEESLALAIDRILPDCCHYFEANYGFIRSFTRTDLVRSYSTSSENPRPFIASPPLATIREWESLLKGKVHVLVDSLENIREKDPENYERFRARGLTSFCLTPIFSRGSLVGLIGLANQKEHQYDLELIEILACCLALPIQKRELLEEKLSIQFSDPLSGYLNFEGYKQKVEAILRRSPHRKYSLWYCDLKKFKFINDVFGYDAGDRLLKYWLDYIAGSSRPDETFCRISADNISCLRWYEDERELHLRFNKAVENLENFPELAEKYFKVELVAGIYLLNDTDPELSLGEMLNRANMAQKSVKPLPGNHMAFYTEEMRLKHLQEISFTSDMRDALSRDDFILYFQPQKALQQKSDTVHAEVLVRWNYNSSELVMPGQFIHLFEQNGLIVDLDYYVFEHACQYLSKTLGKSAKPVCLSINVSRITILQPHFAEAYRDIRDHYNLPDGCIVLEFTENGVVEDLQYFSRLITKLQSYGFLCAMDDFGAGQSSLNTLQHLPLNILKLDRQFFNSSKEKERNHTIISSILYMAKALGMDTVAEGIEKESQLQGLREMGCDYIQGYIYSRPLAEADFEKLLME